MITNFCSSCTLPTRSVSKITGKPLCPHCQARRLQVKTLASMSRPPARPRPALQCLICMADEVITEVNGVNCSSLRNGICRDRAACEERQPPLIPMEELNDRGK